MAFVDDTRYFNQTNVELAPAFLQFQSEIVRVSGFCDRDVVELRSFRTAVRHRFGVSSLKAGLVLVPKANNSRLSIEIAQIRGDFHTFPIEIKSSKFFNECQTGPKDLQLILTMNCNATSLN
jgi:hypothetical protein